MRGRREEEDEEEEEVVGFDLAIWVGVCEKR